MLSQQELISRAGKGDADAFAQVLAPLEKRLYHIALGLAGNHHDAEDLWQNTVFVAWKAIAKLRDAGKFRAWITRILVNEANALFRRKQVLPDLPGTMPEMPDQGTPSVEDYLHVHSCLQQLSREQREAVVLRFWMDFTLQDIAQVTGVPLSTAKTRLYQGMSKLQTVIEEEVTRGEARSEQPS